MFFPERIKNIHEKDKVLEIGPGASPFPRSDIYLDKKFSDDAEMFAQRGSPLKLEYTKPIYYYDGNRFPFIDREFNYSISSHVLEHVSPNELPRFIEEIERVSGRGYIEVPSLFYEYLFNFHVHKWLINYKDDKLLFLSKKNVQFNKIQDCYYYMFIYGFEKNNNQLINEFIDFFMIGFEWKKKINYQIVNNLNQLIDEKDLVYYKEYFSKLKKEETPIGILNNISKKITFKRS